jgi:hypothetical protein
LYKKATICIGKVERRDKKKEEFIESISDPEIAI